MNSRIFNSNRISRRRFNGILAAAAALAGGCNRQSGSRQLNLLAWSEYIPQQVIDGFSAESGIHVSYATYSTNEEMLSKLLAGGTHYDLIQPSEYTVEALIRQNKLEPLDLAAIAQSEEHRAGHAPSAL